MLTSPETDKMYKYNAELIKHSPQATKFPFWRLFGAPEGGFGGEGPVFHQFGIVFTNFRLFFGLAKIFLIKSRFGLFDCF